MGFFSRIKKFFAAEKDEAPTESKPEVKSAVKESVKEIEPESTAAAEKAGAEIKKAEIPETKVAAPDITSAESRAEPSLETNVGETVPEAGGQAVASSSEKPGREESGKAGNVVEEAGKPENAEIGGEDAELLARLRQAPPKLSEWLAITLDGVERADDLFWRRLEFLLASLDAPVAERQVFLDDFGRWLERMEYVYLDEFRSELQYRLALALELEDEEDERNRLFLKFGEGLARTREQLGKRLDALFHDYGELNQEFWDELEELFIMADLGYETSVDMVERLKERARKKNVVKASEARVLLLEELREIFRGSKRITATGKPEVVLMIGVNGAGKTTTIAKLAHRDRMNGKKTLIIAADTFRAAAIDQMRVWAERVGSDFYARQPGSDPASVAWEGMDLALKTGVDVVYVDTAGRLQTKVNLMEELGKIRQVIGKKVPGAPHRSALVLDATAGQNALSQAKLFKNAAGASELILTKLDGTAKGGVAIAAAMREDLPITFVGLGEKMEDLRPFDGDAFAAALLGEESASGN